MFGSLRNSVSGFLYRKTKEGKSRTQTMMAQTARVYPCFRSMKQLRWSISVPTHPPCLEGMLVHYRVTPSGTFVGALNGIASLQDLGQ